MTTPPWMARRLSAAALAALLSTLLAACAGGPPAPDWQMNAQSALARFAAAYMDGNAVVEAQEFARARGQIARTGKLDLLARAELVRCATRVASLVFEECAGFAPLRDDAAAPEGAYARYLAGNARAQDIALLPAPHRAVAGAGSDTAAAAAVDGIADPLSKLVAAGVLLRAGRATPALFENAVNTASDQGWRRPLLAWLGAQATRAEQAGQTRQAQQLRRRIALAGGAAPR